MVKWNKDSVAAKLLDEKFIDAEFTSETKPKEAWESENEFHQFSLSIFRTHFNAGRKKHGLHLKIVSFKSEAHR